MITATPSQPSLLDEEQATAWQLAPTYILQTLELFNWGGFGGMHKADIDAQGSAIIGPTGSGKTTLVDALMTLLTANPKYNLASTGFDRFQGALLTAGDFKLFMNGGEVVEAISDFPGSLKLGVIV